MSYPFCFMTMDSQINHFSLLVSIYMAAQVPMCTYKLPSKQECFQGLIGKLVKAKTCAKNKHPKWNNELGECAEHSPTEQEKMSLFVPHG